MSNLTYQQCIHPDCGATYDAGQIVFRCTQCDNLLDVVYDWEQLEMPADLHLFESRRCATGRSRTPHLESSGVWRYRELLPVAPASELVTIGEGRTLLQNADWLALELGMKPGSLFLQYEGMNPSGSFKDNGMAAAFTIARRLHRRRVACASTGNTSASMALYAAVASGPRHAVQAIVFIGSGKIAFGKLAQALDYGALTLQIDGDFDDCMRRVLEAAAELDIYLMNSINPFRLEGQKTIMYRVLEGLNWEVPEWIIVPGGNLGNSSAFGKAFMELKHLGLIKKLPRIAIINACGANTLSDLVNQRHLRWNGGRFEKGTVSAKWKEMDDSGYKATTVASAIEISRPVNWPKALRTLEHLSGVVREVNDASILDHKAMVGRYGYGCEPASAASVAGLRLLLQEQIISKNDRVVCILTGHALKDPDATVDYHLRKQPDHHVDTPWPNPPHLIPNDLDAIRRALQQDTHEGLDRRGNI